MTPVDLVSFPDPRLRDKAKPVTDIDDALLMRSSQMINLMLLENGVGLAANQAGSPLSLFVYQGADTQCHTILNPEIREFGDEPWSFAEGCLSLPHVYFNLIRPKKILLVGTELSGEEVQIEADDLTARLFQHEVDHLNGRLVIDLVTRDQRREAIRQMKKRADRAPRV